MADLSVDAFFGPIDSDVTADVTTALTGLDHMGLGLSGGTTSTLDSTSSLDLKPVAVDSCVRLELAPPPPTEVHTPYEQVWAWSVLGLELFAVSVRGSTSTHVRPEHSGPVVIEG